MNKRVRGIDGNVISVDFNRGYDDQRELDENFLRAFLKKRREEQARLIKRNLIVLTALGISIVAMNFVIK